MGRVRPNLGTPYGTDGPWLAALLDVMSDLYDLLDTRLPADPASAGGGEPTSGSPIPASEPDRRTGPGQVVPVTEPAPNTPPPVEDDDLEEVTGPAPPGRSLPPPPPRRGRGSGLDAWQAFANIAGVKYPDDAGRDDIIAACIDAGVIEDE